jgi:hypothetical protein
LVLGLVRTAWGATYYVDTAGDNSTGTSWATAKTTLAAGADLLTIAGDTLYVAGGTYTPVAAANLDNVNGTALAPVTVYLSAGTVLDGTAAMGTTGQTIIAATGLTVNVFSCTKNYHQVLTHSAGVPAQITGGPATTYAIQGSSAAGNMTVSNIEIDDAYAAVRMAGATPTVTRMLIQGQIAGSTTYMVWFNSTATGGLFCSNIMRRSANNGILFGCEFDTGATIVNNTFGGSGQGSNNNVAYVTGTTTFKNNLVFNCGYHGLAIATGNCTEDYNWFTGAHGWAPSWASYKGIYVGAAATHNGGAVGTRNLGAHSQWRAPDIPAHSRIGYVWLNRDDLTNLDLSQTIAASASGEHIFHAVEVYSWPTAGFTAADLQAFVNDGHDLACHAWAHTITATATTAVTITAPAGYTLTTVVTGDTGSYYTALNSYASWSVEYTLTDGVTPHQQSFDHTAPVTSIVTWVNTLGAGFSAAAPASPPEGRSRILAVCLEEVSGVDCSAGYAVQVHKTAGPPPAGRFWHVELWESKQFYEDLIQTDAAPGSRAATYTMRMFVAPLNDINDDMIDALAACGYLGARSAADITAGTDARLFLDSLNPFELALGTLSVLAADGTEGLIHAQAAGVATWCAENGVLVLPYGHAESTNTSIYALAAFAQATSGRARIGINTFLETLWGGGVGEDGVAWTVSAGDTGAPDHTLTFTRAWPVRVNYAPGHGSDLINAGTDLGDGTLYLDYDGLNQDGYGSGWELGAYAYRPKGFPLLLLIPRSN